MKYIVRMYIAEELRTLRTKENITIMELAKRVGISENTIVRYEKGIISIRVDTLEKLLNYYNTNFVIFFKNIYAYKHNVMLNR